MHHHGYHILGRKTLMSLENDITKLQEADVFKPASKTDLKHRLLQKAQAEKDIPKENIVAELDKSMSYQFESYSWRDFIDDVLTDDRGYTEADRNWAEENTSYKAYRTDIDERKVN